MWCDINVSDVLAISIFRDTSLNGVTTHTTMICIYRPVKMDVKNMWEGIDHIQAAQDRLQWRALVNTATNFRIP